MPDRVYVETTIISYLTARPHRDVVIAGHQQVTREWWDTCRQRFDLCISQLVIEEASAGDSSAAGLRLELTSEMNILETNSNALSLARSLLNDGALPPKSAADALHIAVAATHGVPYLLTWNCKHLANAIMRPVIESVCLNNKLKAPIICTPEELMEALP